MEKNTERAFCFLLFYLMRNFVKGFLFMKGLRKLIVSTAFIMQV